MLPLQGNVLKNFPTDNTTGGKWTRAGVLVTTTDYTNIEVRAALSTHRTEVFRYEQHRIVGGVWSEALQRQVGGTWQLIADITNKVESCHLKFDGHGEHFHVTATMTIDDPARTINWITDKVRIFHMILMPDGNYLNYMRGTFYVPNPKIPMKYDTVQSIETKDSLSVLHQITLSDWFKVPSVVPVTGGTTYSPSTFDQGDAINWVKRLINDRFPEAGIAIPDSTIRVQDEPPPAVAKNRSKIYSVGTTYLDTANSLLVFCGYDIMRADPDGSYRSAPFVKPSLRNIDWSYIANSTSTIVSESGEMEQDLWDAPNEWIRVVTRPDAPLLRSRLTLTDPLNPLSTAYRYRKVSDYAEIDAPDQATLDTVVAALYEDGQRVLKKLTIKTPIMPHGHNDKVIVQWTSAHPWYVDGNGVYIVYGWEFDCTPGAEMTLLLELCPFTPVVGPADPEGSTSVSTPPTYALGLAIGVSSYGLGTEVPPTVAGTGAYAESGAEAGAGSELAVVTGTGAYSQFPTATDTGLGTHPQPVVTGTGVAYMITPANQTGVGQESVSVTIH